MTGKFYNDVFSIKGAFYVVKTLSGKSVE